MIAHMTVENIKSISVKNNLMTIEVKGGAVPVVVVDLNRVSKMGFDFIGQENKND